LRQQTFFGANLANFEPYLTGEKTLAELAEAGVATWMVKKARVKPLLRATRENECGAAADSFGRAPRP